MTEPNTPGHPPLFTDTRRLFGPSLWLDAPGVVLDVPLPHGHEEALLEGWKARVSGMCEALGWGAASDGAGRDFGGCAIRVRRHARGTTVGFTAPPGALMSATTLNEWAIHSVAEALGTRFDAASLDEGHLPLDPEAALERLRAMVAEESAGPLDELLFQAPPGIPIALVTGSNGKTTTTRLLAAILRAHGHTVGFTSTDGVQIGDVLVERGDWSGPSGAARVLGDPGVTAAVLEVARGGLLRRGLVVSRADVAVITNVVEDHFGEYGVDSLDDLARVKGLVTLALGPEGVLVLNGDDTVLSPPGSDAGGALSFTDRQPARVSRFSLEAPWPGALPPLEEIPITAGGLARYNAANALAAAAAAAALGVPDALIASTLRSFGESEADNPGRLVRQSVGGATVIVDYAHNPHGLAALLGAARAADGGRLLVLLAQAGDRDDDAIRELARAAWAARPDHVIVRDEVKYLRGRPRGEVPGILNDELERLGARGDQVRVEPEEERAVEEALRWARAGDLLILPIHATDEREKVLALLSSLRAAGWRAGDALPG